jgi:hypothetical protein
VTTPFCPHCGAKAREPDILDGLLTLVRKTAKSQVALADKLDELADEHHRKRARSRRQAAAKWAAWGDALEALLARTTSGSPAP